MARPLSKTPPSSETLAKLVAGQQEFNVPEGLTLKLLAALCQDKRIALEMVRVRPEELWPEYPALVGALYGYVSQYKSAPQTNLNTLLEAAGMPDGSAELLELVKQPVQDPAFLMDQLYREARSNVVQSFVPDLMGRLSTGDVDGFLLQQEQLKRELLRSQKLNLGHSLADDEWFHRKETNTKLLFKMLIDHLDENNLGGKREQLVLFRAPYGTGKTTFLMWVCICAAAAGLNVTFFTLEDGEDQIRRKFKRMLYRLREGRVFPHYQLNPVIQLITPDDVHSVDDDEYVRSVSANDERRGHIRIVKLTETVDTSETVGATLEHLATLESYPTDVCAVDYADRLADKPLKDEKEYERLRRVMVNLRVIAENHKLAMFTAEQTNRDGVKEKSSMRGDTSSGSFGKNYSPDLVLALSRTEEQRKNNTATLFVDKARGAADGEKILLSQNLSLGMFVTDSKVISDKGPELPSLDSPVALPEPEPEPGPATLDLDF